ncbi:SH3 domain-containing protein, partial [Streptomyces sp. GC420]|nr:SH3 domain-containing protein [Streptomyces sp. GC420]
MTRRLIRSLCALLVVGALPPATAVAGTTTGTPDPASASASAPPSAERPADPTPRSTWRMDLTSTSADQRNISHRPDGSITVKSARIRTESAPGSSFAVYTAPARSLGRTASAFTLRPRAEVPVGTRLVTEVRGSSHHGTWTQWSTPGRAGKVRLSEAVSVVQVRVTLLGRRSGTAPSVSGITVGATAKQPTVRSPRAGAGATAVTYRLYATREGLVGGTTANGHVIQPRDHFVALPSRRMLASNGGSEYRVRVCYPRTGRCETAPVWDVGPWNTKDDYWNPPSQRQMWTDLPQGTPEAQAAYQSGYNGGRDEFGRRVANPAGIDLADGTFWDGLGMNDNDWVDVTFQPTD